MKPATYTTSENIRAEKQTGFSVIEITVVMAIISVLVGIAIPVYISMKPSFQLSGAVSQLSGDLMWARMQAISQNNEFKIFFLDNHRYQILDDDNDDGDIDSGETTITKDIQEKYEDVTFSSTANPVFQPRGNASGATITLSNSSGTKTISIALTGRVKIN
jgi:type IV fimbrial biogenesis protein FimT